MGYEISIRIFNNNTIAFHIGYISIFIVSVLSPFFYNSIWISDLPVGDLLHGQSAFLRLAKRNRRNEITYVRLRFANRTYGPLRIHA
ncbi:hypothetical protein BJL95_23405 [Methylomonas sp. LWB]|nr:hypothetical protein BJL95_23405 [Methylomonas sp. LWB]